MATHPSMRRSARGVDRGAGRPGGATSSPSGSILSSIVYDFRRVTGPLDPEPEFEAAIREAGRDPAFLRHLAHRALADRPPTGFLRDLVLERKGEHTGRFDVKHGGITLDRQHRAARGREGGHPRQGDAGPAGGRGGRRDAWTGRTPTSSRRRSRSCGRCACDTRRIRFGAESSPTTSSIRQRSGAVTRRGLKEAFDVISRTQRVVAAEFGHQAAVAAASREGRRSPWRGSRRPRGSSRR